MRPECIMCLLKGKMELFPKDASEEKKVEYMQRLMKEFSEMPKHYGAPVVVKTVNRIRKEMFGIEEDYSEIKTHFNKLMMEQVPMMEKNLSESADSLKLAIQYCLSSIITLLYEPPQHYYFHFMDKESSGPKDVLRIFPFPALIVTF